MLVSGINLLMLVIPPLLLHTRNLIPLQVLNHSTARIVGFYSADMRRMDDFIHLGGCIKK